MVKITASETGTKAGVSTGRAKWVKPAVQRMASGSAEAGGANRGDGNIGLS